MKVKIEKVIIGIYDYDSIIVKLDKGITEIVFPKSFNIKQYENKTVELTNSDGNYVIKPAVSTGCRKNTD